MLPLHAYAQVTDDQVNAVAKRLYCPVCENQPLDTCPTEACHRWKEEIRLQLSEGQTEEQVIADFVRRFGERAIGAPLDPTLRALTILVPLALGVLALLIGVMVFTRWRRSAAPPTPMPAADARAGGDDYRARLERDVQE